MIVFAVACLVWIGLLSLALVWFMGTGIGVGWIIAGALCCALVVWIIVMSGEFRNAVDVPEGHEEMDFADIESLAASKSSLDLFTTTPADILIFEAAARRGMEESKRLRLLVKAQTTPSVDPDKRNGVPHDPVRFPRGNRADGRG